jgi:hypothetical protein
MAGDFPQGSSDEPFAVPFADLGDQPSGGGARAGDGRGMTGEARAAALAAADVLIGAADLVCERLGVTAAELQRRGEARRGDIADLLESALELAAARLAARRRGADGPAPWWAAPPAPEPWPGYDTAIDRDVIARLSRLRVRDLDALRRYEAAGPGRDAVVEAIDRARVANPIPAFDDLDATEIIGHLDALSAVGLRRVRDYERRHGGRIEVLRAVDERLGSAASASA